MKSRPLTSTAAILVVALLMASCSNKQVSRIEPDTVTDLSGQ